MRKRRIDIWCPCLCHLANNLVPDNIFNMKEDVAYVNIYIILCEFVSHWLNLTKSYLETRFIDYM